MQDYWRELPFPSPGDLPDPGIKPACPAWQADSLSLNHHRSPILGLLLFSHSVTSNSLRPHGWEHARPPCPSPSPRACSNSCPLSRWCHPSISSSVFPFSSCLQSFPAAGSFPVNWLFISGGQSIEAWALIQWLVTSGEETRERMPCEDRDRNRSYAATRQRPLVTTTARRNKRPFTGSVPCQHLWTSSPQNHERINFCCFKPPGLGCFVTAAPEKLTQPLIFVTCVQCVSF